MKSFRYAAACLSGGGLAYGLTVLLGIGTDPRKMADDDHLMAYRLFPLLLLALPLVLGGYALRSRALFWISLAAAIASLWVPRQIVRESYSSLESAFMASLQDTFWYTLNWAFCAASGMWIALVLLAAGARLRRKSASTTARSSPHPRTGCSR